MLIIEYIRCCCGSKFLLIGYVLIYVATFMHHVDLCCRQFINYSLYISLTNNEHVMMYFVVIYIYI